MHLYVFEGRMTALSAISHNGGQSFGVTSKLRREKVVQPDGSVADIPVISGNALRGMLRDRGMLHMCRHLGYGEADDTDSVRGLSLPAFHFLFSGGALTSAGDVRGLDIDRARQLREAIPLVGLFGGALGNMILPGKCKIGKAIPICAETAHLLPPAFRPAAPESIWSYVQEEMYTRMDDEKHEHKRALIAPAARGLLDDARRAQAVRRASGDDRADPNGSQQMRYFVETLAAGTALYWKIVLDDPTDIEFEAFLTTLVEFSRAPYIGGKSNVGLGEIAVNFESWISIDSRVHQPDGQAVALPAGAAYAAHLRSQGDAIRAILGGIA